MENNFGNYDQVHTETRGVHDGWSLLQAKTSDENLRKIVSDHENRIEKTANEENKWQMGFETSENFSFR